MSIIASSETIALVFPNQGLLISGFWFNAIWLSRRNRLRYLCRSILFRRSQRNHIHHITINLRSWTRTSVTRHVRRTTSQTHDSYKSIITASSAHFLDGHRGRFQRPGDVLWSRWMELVFRTFSLCVSDIDDCIGRYCAACAGSKIKQVQVSWYYIVLTTDRTECLSRLRWYSVVRHYFSYRGASFQLLCKHCLRPYLFLQEYRCIISSSQDGDISQVYVYNSSFWNWAQVILGLNPLRGKG